MIYIRLALAIVDIISRLLAWSEQTQWLNEGARREAAARLKEANDAMAKAMGVAKEVDDLNEAALLKRVEAEGWFRD